MIVSDYRARQHPLSAAEKLVEMIIREGEEDLISKTLKHAPVWLLKFTLVPLDARYLKLELPDLSAAPAWGSLGLRDARRWPLLPLGIMTAGHPVPNNEMPLLEECSIAWYLKWRGLR